MQRVTVGFNGDPTFFLFRGVRFGIITWMWYNNYIDIISHLFEIKYIRQLSVE